MSLKSEQNISTVVASIQKILLYVFIAILPISILPFPWDLTEKGMSIVVLFFTVLIAGLEIIKTIWSGKISFVKRGIDLIIFSLFISAVLTTIFSQDSNLSLFGYNYRLSAGFLSIGSIFLLTFIARDFISTKKDLLNVFNAFFVGSILASFLSIISLFGGNIFNIIPKIGTPNMEGFPTLGSPVALAIYNSISIFLAYISLGMYKNDNEQMDASWFAVLTIFVNIISLTLFSANEKVFLIGMVFITLWMLVLAVIFLKKRRNNLKEKLKQAVVPLIILLAIILIQIGPIKSLIFGETEVITSLNLSVDASWQVVSKSLMRSLKNGIFGLGLDSFGVIFTEFKPVELINIELTTGFNEIFTSLSNGGFLWLVIWLLLGWYILKDLITDIRNYDQKDKSVILFDTLLLFIYLTSFLTSYTVALRFLFFLMLSSGVILRSTLKQQDVDNLLLKMWAMGTGKKDEKSFPVISVFFTIIISLFMILGIWKLGRVTLSSIYLLRAESYISKESDKLGDREATLEEKIEITGNLYRWYSKALEYDRTNPLTNRKASVVAIDKLGILMREYKDSSDENILSEAVALRSQAFEYSRTAINLSPSLYSSYNSRASIYLAIINLGYTEYIRDGISVIDEAIGMNPLDYQNYYNKAQLYYLLQNYELALASSTKTLTIKGDYIPALLLSANINGIQGNIEIQRSYLEAIKTIMEANNLQEIQLYEDIIKQIDSTKPQDEPTAPVEDSVDVLEIEQ
ncbi:MAG: hypothetical protein PHG60_02445 [Candidatus Dojkabacteria bacterium]|nr:hypothetical protein [Candidatus Dojkabacteria bacterium]